MKYTNTRNMCFTHKHVGYHTSLYSHSNSIRNNGYLAICGISRISCDIAFHVYHTYAHHPRVSENITFRDYDDFHFGDVAFHVLPKRTKYTHKFMPDMLDFSLLRAGSGGYFQDMAL